MRRRMRTLREEVERLRPDLEDVDAEIAAGHVLVRGVPTTNPRSRVEAGTSVVVREPKTFRGRVKLGAALDAFEVPVEGRVALDAGASAGGFVQALLEAGARRVYAVEVGFGQLLGSLRQDPRVVNLERTNIGDLDQAVVPDAVEVVTLDLGYLALAVGVPQLNTLHIADDAHLVALVKPVAELGLATPPTDEERLDEARRLAAEAIEDAGWRVAASVPSPIRGSHGAIETFIHARRA